jgi:hypothetical protein
MLPAVPGKAGTILFIQPHELGDRKETVLSRYFAVAAGNRIVIDFEKQKVPWSSQ